MNVLSTLYDAVHHNFFSVGALIPVTFTITVALILFTIPKKSRATIHLLITFILLFIFYGAYFLAAMIYHPFAAYHRIITIILINPLIIHFTILFFHFPYPRNTKFAKYFMIVLYSIHTAIATYTLYFLLQSDKSYHFNGHYWDFSADKTSTYFGIVVLVFFLNILVVGLWRTIVTKSKERWTVLAIAVIAICTTGVPAVINVLSRQGMIDRGAYQTTQDMITIIGFFLVTILYLNTTKDKSNFMVRILGVTLASFLIVFQVLSFYSLKQLDIAYDDISKKDMLLAIYHKSDKKDLCYIITYDVEKKSNNIQWFSKKKKNINTGIISNLSTKPVPITFADIEKNFDTRINNKRFYRKNTEGNEHYIAYFHYNKKSNKIYEAGYSYISYRNFIHNITLNYIIILAIILVVIFTAYQFFFTHSFYRPIQDLLKGILKIKDGQYDVFIPVRVWDEFGFITHNFNLMAGTIYTTNKSLDDYANNLELKVSERTKELQKTKDALWGEMELAKKIQTVLLPENPTISGYEITAFMEPADEVGGDYYDVIHVEGRDWIIIGDVAGHGVPAGLIMMMVQTSIQVALRQHYDKNPSEILTIINKAITQNIKKISDYKYMTITVLACHDQGKFYFAGLHLDILVYRSELKTIENIETDGVWLGIMDDIEGMLHDGSFELGINDVMILYTDGIIEAMIGDPEKKGDPLIFFGIDRLKEILLEKGTHPIHMIKDQILIDLQAFRVFDDVTMVIIKRTK